MEHCNPLRCLVRLALRDSDSAEERNRKEIWVPITVVAVIGFLMALVATQQADHLRYQAAWYGNLWSVALMVLSSLFPILTGTLPKLFVANCCVLFVIGIIIVDWGLAAAQSPLRFWSGVVLVMDVLLALDIARSYQLGVLIMVTVYVVTVNIEIGVRLGLFDIPDWTDQKIEWYELCADPPCAIGISRGLTLAVVVCAVFHVDFLATRGFAENSRREQAAMATTITVADQVVADLALFDLDAAEGVLAEASLPPQLMASFRRLLDNLASYRPYLPESCFNFGDGEPSSTTESRHGLDARTGADSDLGGPPSPDEPPWRHPSEAGRRPSEAGRRPTERTAGSSLSSGCPSPRAVRAAENVLREAHIPQQRNVTLLLCNRCGFLAGCAQTETGMVREWFAAEVERFSATIRTQGGTSDLLAGDHLSATFGAVKPQGSHRSSATRAAWLLSRAATAQPAEGVLCALAALRNTAVACSGKALCGDFGSAAAQRFMVIGGVSSFAVATERAAAAWSIDVLIDAAVHSDVEQFWNCRLREKVSFSKLRAASLIGLWEVIADRLPPGGEQGEWMYELERAVPNPWALYNMVLQQWYGGVTADTLEEAHGAALAGGGDASSGVSAAGLRALIEHIRSVGKPPVADFTPQGLFGVPVPVEHGAAPSSGVEPISC